jgi:hypothetical protein
VCGCAGQVCLCVGVLVLDVLVCCCVGVFAAPCWCVVCVAVLVYWRVCKTLELTFCSMLMIVDLLGC